MIYFFFFLLGRENAQRLIVHVQFVLLLAVYIERFDHFLRLFNFNRYFKIIMFFLIEKITYRFERFDGLNGRQTSLFARLAGYHLLLFGYLVLVLLLFLLHNTQINIQIK